MIEDMNCLLDIENRDTVFVRAIEEVVKVPVNKRELAEAVHLALGNALLPVFTQIVSELLVNRGYALYDLLDFLEECYQKAYPKKDEERRILADAAALAG